VAQAREFRQTKTSQLTVYRCTCCQGIFNLYSQTVFEGRYFRPAQAVLLLRGVTKGDPSAEIAREIEVSRQTVLAVRREIQANAERHQPHTALTDLQTETDEMFQNAGEKR
jgi:transposase-like protein